MSSLFLTLGNMLVPEGNKLRIQRSTHIEISLLEDYLNEASELQNNGALEEAMLIHEKL